MNSLNVVLSLPTRDIGYHSEQLAAAQSAANRLRVTLQVVYADGDALLQSQQLLNAVQTKGTLPDAIIFEPVGTCLPQVARLAVGKGVGWVVLNREADYIAELRRNTTTPVFEISTDHEEVGRIQGQQFTALLKQGGLVLYIEGPGSSGAAERRCQGMLSTKSPGIEVKALRGNWTEEGAYHAVQSWLRLSTSRQLPVGVIGCQNDAMAMGARKAFQELAGAEGGEKWLRLPFTGCDGLPDLGQAWVRSGQLAATVVVHPNAGMAVEMLVQAIQTGKQPVERTMTKPTSLPPIEKL